MRLLIADNGMIEGQALYKMLQKNLGDGCRMSWAVNDREVLKIYEEGEIQIAILNIEMPGINGVEAAQQIRQTNGDCCIIFLTVFDEFSYAKKAITVRALNYPLKPYDEQELMLMVEEAMHITRGQRQGGGDENENENPTTADTEEPEGGGRARPSKAMSSISQHIHEDYMFDISMHDAARAIDYSETYLRKLFKQCFDQDFTSYLTRYRIKEVKEMLEQPTVNVKETGRVVGYGDSNYLAKVFKHITDQSPTEYRLSIFQKG